MKRITTAALLALFLTFGVVACGDDEETTTNADESTAQTTEDTASAEEVTVTTSDAKGGGYEWDVSPTPTADTQSITFVNDSKEPHALVYARIADDYTLDEAYELEGKKGSATQMFKGDTFVEPGKSETVDVTETAEPGNYALLCPLSGKDGPHYKLGQSLEFTIG